MLNSKALKDFEPPRHLYYLYRKLVGRPIERLKHHLSYLKLLKNDYDWDYSGIYSLLLHRLKRTEVALKNGHAIQDDDVMKSLRLAIKLVDRLNEDDYWAAHTRHEKKWGELQNWFTPTDDTDYSQWNSKRPNANTEEEKAQEKEDYRLAIISDEKARERDRRNFFNIMNKYIMTWWD